MDRKYTKGDYKDALQKILIREKHEEEIFKYAKEYIKKNIPILCIKDYDRCDEYGYHKKFYKDKFYRILNIQLVDVNDYPDFTILMLITDNGSKFHSPMGSEFLNYYQFNEFFEMKTIYDIRKRKIERLLSKNYKH